MKFYINLTLCCALSILHGEETAPPLTESEALAIVRAQRETKAANELERKQRILGIEAESEAVQDKGSHKMILRRVDWQPIEPLVAKEADLKAPADTDFSGLVPDDYVHSMISVGSTVYDDNYTEVTWREPGVSGAKPFTIWVNRNFKYLSSIHQFDYNGVHYSYMGFTGSVDTDAYITHPATGEKFLPYNLPDWMPSAEDFPADEAAYIILVSDESVVVPELLYQQIDALLVHLTENEAELISAYKRAKALRKAKEQLDKLEPEKKEDVVINYWPIQSNADL